MGINHQAAKKIARMTKGFLLLLAVLTKVGYSVDG
jgi:hypothetical protein